MEFWGNMVSKITFLGTAGDIFVYSKQIRTSGGFVLNTGGYQFFIDPGPGALTRTGLCNINPRETTAVIATHCHVNHASDINAIIGAMSYNGIDRIGVVIANKSVIEGGDGYIPVISEFHKGCVERIISLEEGQKVGIENMEIRALKAIHDDPNAIGLKFFTPDFVLGYTSDTAYSKELVEQYRKCDVLIINLVHASGESSDNNLTCDDVIKILKGAVPQLAIITHFGKSMLNSDPMLEARRIQKETGVQVIAATDGMVISPNYYSAEMKQKTLNLYPKEDNPEEEVKEESKKGKAEEKIEDQDDSEDKIEGQNKSEEVMEIKDSPKEKQSFLLDK